MKDNSKKHSILIAYTILVCLCYILPMIKYSVPYIVMGSLLLVSYAFYYNKMPLNVRPGILIVVCSVFLGLMNIIVVFFGNTTEALNEVIRSLRIFAPALLYLTLNRYQCRKGMTVIFLVLSALFMYVGLSTLRGVIAHPNLARDLAGGNALDSSIAAYRMQNIGGFELCYAIGFVAVFIIGVMLMTKKTWVKLLCLLLSLLCIFFFFEVEYTTLLLLFFVFAAIMYYRMSGSTVGKVTVAIIIILLVFLTPMIVKKLSTVSLSMLSFKFASINSFFETKNVNELGSRPEYLLDAFKRFLQSPLWGNSAFNDDGTMVREAQTVHSTLFGYLQNTGLIGTAAFYVPLFETAKVIAGTLPMKPQKTIFGVSFAMLIVLSILNPVQYCFELYFAIFLFIPCGLKTVCQAKENHHEQVGN